MVREVVPAVVGVAGSAYCEDPQEDSPIGIRGRTRRALSQGIDSLYDAIVSAMGAAQLPGMTLVFSVPKVPFTGGFCVSLSRSGGTEPRAGCLQG